MVVFHIGCIASVIEVARIAHAILFKSLDSDISAGIIAAGAATVSTTYDLQRRLRNLLASPEWLKREETVKEDDLRDLRRLRRDALWSLPRFCPRSECQLPNGGCVYNVEAPKLMQPANLQHHRRAATGSCSRISPECFDKEQAMYREFGNFAPAMILRQRAGEVGAGATWTALGTSVAREQTSTNADIFSLGWVIPELMKFLSPTAMRVESRQDRLTGDRRDASKMISDWCSEHKGSQRGRLHLSDLTIRCHPRGGTHQRLCRDPSSIAHHLQDPSPHLLLFSWTMLALTTSRFHQRHANKRVASVILLCSICAALALSTSECADTNSLILTYIPWCLGLGMLCNGIGGAIYQVGAKARRHGRERSKMVGDAEKDAMEKARVVDTM